jgi:AcrR family transcriptional regulator
VIAARLDRDDRRDALLNAAAALVASGDAEAVSMEAVAEEAGVSRPLVYKHFANRHELLGALYAREAQALHDEIGADVAKARTLDENFRALVRGALSAQASRGATFAALRAAGTHTTDDRQREKRDRDRETLRFFARRAVRQYGVAEDKARAAAAILLGAIDSVLTAWRARPTPEHAALLEDTYVTVAVAGIKALKGGGR